MTAATQARSATPGLAVPRIGAASNPVARRAHHRPRRGAAAAGVLRIGSLRRVPCRGRPVTIVVPAARPSLTLLPPPRLPRPRQSLDRPPRPPLPLPLSPLAVCKTLRARKLEVSRGDSPSEGRHRGSGVEGGLLAMAAPSGGWRWAAVTRLPARPVAGLVAAARQAAAAAVAAVQLVVLAAGG